MNMQAHQEVRIPDSPSAESGSSAHHRPSGAHYSLQAVFDSNLEVPSVLTTNIGLGHAEIWAIHSWRYRYIGSGMEATVHTDRSQANSGALFKSLLGAGEQL
jgi:hypothetical protein